VRPCAAAAAAACAWHWPRTVEPLLTFYIAPAPAPLLLWLAGLILELRTHALIRRACQQRVCRTRILYSSYAARSRTPNAGKSALGASPGLENGRHGERRHRSPQGTPDGAKTRPPLPWSSLSRPSSVSPSNSLLAGGVERWRCRRGCGAGSIWTRSCPGPPVWKRSGSCLGGWWCAGRDAGR
jgi:hypothetical protein